MEMVSSRNATSHTYVEVTANRIAETIRQEYCYEFEHLLSVFDALLMDDMGPKKADSE
jgi:hypothetical protein